MIQLFLTVKLSHSPLNIMHVCMSKLCPTIQLKTHFIQKRMAECASYCKYVDNVKWQKERFT